jgi:hypothetical protein
VASGVGPGEHGESSGIWIINVLTATPRQIRGNAEGAVPSPDGSLVAFRNSSGQPQVLVADTGGGNERLLATATLEENFGQLQWSPDGKRIGVIVRRVGDRYGSVEAIDISSGKRQTLTRQPSPHSFVWLPDGRLVVATHDTGDFGDSFLQLVEARGRTRQVQIGPGSTVADMSATADGKQLVLVRQNEQSDVYVGALSAKGAMAASQRLTLNDRDDVPTGWLRDSNTVLFESDRNGSLDVFRQASDAAAADSIVGGPDDQYGAQQAFDGAVLYWSAAEKQPARLMRLPPNGGAATMLLQAARGASFRCARAAPVCALATVENGQLRFERFDATTGARQQWRSVAAQPATLFWDIAANGSSIAMVDAGDVRILGATPREDAKLLASTFSGFISGLAAGAMPGEWLVTSTASRESQIVAAGRGAVRVVWSSPRKLATAWLSPDEKHVAIGVTSSSSNAVLVERF